MPNLKTIKKSVLRQNVKKKQKQNFQISNIRFHIEIIIAQRKCGEGVGVFWKYIPRQNSGLMFQFKKKFIYDKFGIRERKCQKRYKNNNY